MLFGETISLPDGGTVTFDPRFLSAQDADAAYAALLDELDFEAREVVLFGRRIPQPRLIAWGGELPYRYSGQTLEPRPLSPTTKKLLDRVNATTGAQSNHVLVNRYRDGHDSMGWHADDEPELGPEPTVVSLSLGTSRRFVMRPRRKGRGASLSFDLGHGALLVMSGACQEHYRHAVPKEPHVTGQRLSLTLRRVLGAPRESPQRLRQT